MKTKILIADDHKLFNDGIKMMLAEEDSLEIVGQVFNGKEVLYAAHQLQADVLLLDINMPHSNGLSIAAQVLKELPKTKVIMLTMYSDKKFVDDCQSMGVQGYILKNSGMEEVLAAIDAVILGKRYYDPKLQKANIDMRHAGDEFMRQFQLTKREIEIIAMIGQSHTNEEIAEKLFLSLATVKTHRNNINVKLEIKKPADLVKFAIEHGLV